MSALKFYSMIIILFIISTYVLTYEKHLFLWDYDSNGYIDTYDYALYYLQPRYLVELDHNFLLQMNGSNTYETAYNILKWETEYLQYNFDKCNLIESGELVKINSPVQTYVEREGICVEYAIFTASILLNLGYEPYIFDIIDANGYYHSFCVVLYCEKYYAIDQTLPILPLYDNLKYLEKSCGLDIIEVKYYKYYGGINSTMVSNIEYYNYIK